MTLETRDLGSFYSQRKFVYEFTTNNNFFSCKQKLLLYCYICYVFPFSSKDFVCPLLRWIILDFELERIKKNPKESLKHNVLDGQMELILKHKCTFIWCSYHFKYTILCYYSVSSVKKKNYMSKGKTMLSQAAWFFHILCRMGIFLKRFTIHESGIIINMRNK